MQADCSPSNDAWPKVTQKALVAANATDGLALLPSMVCVGRVNAAMLLYRAGCALTGRGRLDARCSDVELSCML